MWQVTYNPSVVVVPSSGGNVSSSGFERRRYTNSSATAGRQVHGKWQRYTWIKVGDIAVSIVSSEESMMKLRMLFFRFTKVLHVL